MSLWALSPKKWKKNKSAIRRGRTEIQRDQAIVERFNRTLAERLFGHQYAVEEKAVYSKPSTPYLRPVGKNEKKLPSGVSVPYLY